MGEAPFDAAWWTNLAALAGVATLAVPVWSLNVKKKKLRRIRDALPERPESFRDKAAAILAEKRGRDVSDWRAVDEACLIVGYLLLLGSAAARIVAPLLL